jgi:hypothetical protein
MGPAIVATSGLGKDKKGSSHILILHRLIKRQISHTDFTQIDKKAVLTY